MTVQELSHLLSLTVYHLPAPDTEVTGGHAGDLLSWVLGNARLGDAWLTIMSNPNVAAVALMTEVACIVLTDGVTPDEAMLRRAQQNEINVLGTTLPTFEAAAALRPLLP